MRADQLIVKTVGVVKVGVIIQVSSVDAVTVREFMIDSARKEILGDVLSAGKTEDSYIARNRTIRVRIESEILRGSRIHGHRTCGCRANWSAPTWWTGTAGRDGSELECASSSCIGRDKVGSGYALG